MKKELKRPIRLNSPPFTDEAKFKQQNHELSQRLNPSARPSQVTATAATSVLNMSSKDVIIMVINKLPEK